MTDKFSQKERRPNPKDLSLDLKDWIAECQSLQPDRTLSVRTIGSSWDALCLIYILSHIASFYWITDDLHRRMAEKAFAANYQGEWKTVQFLLEQNPQTPEEFYDNFLQFHDPEEFFGNLRKRAKRLSLIIKTKKRDPHGPVARTLRARGYKDKGTYHPPHEFHGESPEKDEKLDLRKRVGHPLLREKEQGP